MALREGTQQPAGPALVILGATGDLAISKLLPAARERASASYRFGDVHIHLSDRRKGSQIFYKLSRQIIRQLPRTDHEPGRRNFLVSGRANSKPLGDLTMEATYDEMRRSLAKFGYGAGTEMPVFFYCALPPDLIKHVATQLKTHGLLSSEECDGRMASQLVVEKPFGTSGSSAEELWALLTGSTSTGALNLDPDQICLVDHYLYKSMVDQILDYRQNLQADEWTAATVDHVQITVAEYEDIQKEPRTYNVLGAIGDMIQNHLLQLLCITAMDLPGSSNAGGLDYGAVIDNGTEVLRHVQPYMPKEGDGWFVLGQYEGGRSPRLTRETFAALRLHVDTDRWRGVPFFLRTGKRMSQKFAAVTVVFKDGGRIVFRIQRDPAVMLWENGQYVRADSAKPGNAPREDDPHARILEDLLAGHLQRAVSRDWTAEAWRVVAEPHAAVAQRKAELHEYARKPDGPDEANRLTVETGREWLPVGHSLAE